MYFKCRDQHETRDCKRTTHPRKKYKTRTLATIDSESNCPQTRKTTAAKIKETANRQEIQATTEEIKKLYQSFIGQATRTNNSNR